MTAEEETRSPADQLRRLIKQGLDEENEDVITDIMGDEVTPMDAEEPMSAEMLVEQLQQQREAIPDLEHDIETIWEDGDTAIARYVGRGTFENELIFESGPVAGFEAEPTGESVEASGLYVARFEDGQIAEWANYSDQLSFLSQIDALDQADKLVQ